MHNLEEWWTTQSGEENEEFLIPNLHKLDIVNCPKLKFLPYPPRSLSWYLNNSSEVLPEQGFGKLSSSTLPSDMHIHGDFSPDKWDRLQHLPTLESFNVSYCGGLMVFPQVIRSFTSLTTLYLKSLNNLYALPEWFGQLISLQELYIFDCRNLTSLPESMRDTKLKKLHIWGCPSLLQSCKGRDAEKICHIPTHILQPLAQLESGIAF
uniref:R13L1/DRL21-like LRR repeat region domain-containing protein n=1 Tax=Hordeum vulgare subsp. vulgare TaxID=112509 RepID=A0A8I7BB09_HORVV